MTFALWQPRYAEVSIATFPVSSTKIPAVRNYLNMGLGASHELKRRFGQSKAFGFALGKRAGITVLDIDTPDERMVADALTRHGQSPIVVRSGSGNWQIWYKHNGERRLIRPDRSKPIDILGGGFVVAPPSRIKHGHYQFAEGDLGDLQSLPVMRNAAFLEERSDIIREGQRNDKLFHHLLREVRHCDDIETLLDCALTLAQSMRPPLPEREIRRTVASVFRMEEEGKNLVGSGPSIIVTYSQIDHLMVNYPDAFILLLWLRRYHGVHPDFRIPNAMRERLPGGGWSERRIQAARSKLRDLKLLEQIHPDSSFHGAAVYRFTKVLKNE